MEPEFPLLGHLDGLMEDLRGRVPAALKLWDVEGIHQSRVATRRMKAAVDLMRVVLSKRARRPFGRSTRNLRRRLGPLRDADVMIEHLQELRSHAKQQQRAIAWLSERLCREREAMRAESTKQGTAGRRAGEARVVVGGARGSRGGPATRSTRCWPSRSTSSSTRSPNRPTGSSPRRQAARS